MRIISLKSSTKISVVIAAVALLMSSRFAYAVNDVLITADTTIQLSGSDLMVTLASGSTLVSFSAGSTTLTLNLDPSSNVTVKSNNLYTLTNSQSLITQCSGASYSYVDFTSTTTQAVILTPTTTPACLPDITAFNASPSSVTSGQSSSLSWNISNATSVSLDNSLGSQSNLSSGSVSVSPSQTTTYTLTAANSSGTSTSQTTVTVTISDGGVSYGSEQSGVYTPPVMPSGSPANNGVPYQSSQGPAPVTLINDSGTFYLIINNILHGITSPGILYSYGFNFSNAVPATAADMTLTQGSLLLPNDGALVKTNQDSTVYLISGGQRHGFTSASVFLALGFKFSSVLVVTSPELNQEPIGSIISSPTSQHLPGLDINEKGTIYWIGDDDMLHGYPSLAVYNSWHIQNDFSKVVPANAADLALPVGSLVTARVTQ